MAVPDEVSVIVFPDSDRVIPVPAESVTGVLPVVLEFITEVVAVPAETLSDPSFAGEASPSTKATFLSAERSPLNGVPLNEILKIREFGTLPLSD